MKNFLKYTLATIVGILVLNILGFFFLLIVFAAASGSDEPFVDDNTVILAKFNDPVLDRASDNPFDNFSPTSFNMESPDGLNQILKDLKKAKKDEDISGIFLDLSSVPAGMAALEEIRDGLVDFKESGKFILAHSDAYSQKSYYLASVADSIYLTPTGDFQFMGLSSTVLYFKRALEKYGIDVQVIRHGTYKSAVEPFLTDEMSDANREQIGTVLGSMWDKMLAEIAVARDIPVETLQKHADELAIRFDDHALELGLVDGLKFYDEVLDELRTRTEVDEDDDIPSITLGKYSGVELDEKKEATKNKVAVIYAMGSVVMGDAGEGSIGSDRIAKAIRKARKDDKVKAIVFRVNSGGGSALASEVIHREVKLAAAVKPVVASLGDVAASGGYYIVAPADTIVASETTITGSIGVFGLIPNFKELMNDKIGITTGTVKTNKYSDMMSTSRPLTGDERTIIQSYIDDVYVTFVNHVAEGRSMTYEEVDAIGGGRVWSGANAMDIGLVDVFGGLDKAVEIAVEMADLEDYRISNLPELEDPFEELIQDLTGGAKARMLRKELGESYELYKKVEEIQDMRGIQAVMPYTIDIY